MATWLVPRGELTLDQIRAIELKTDEHRVMFGPPGSGKTQVLLYRARHLADKLNVPSDRFRILVYTNVLKSYIRSALDLLNLPADCVLTFDDWCRRYYEEQINRRLPWNAARKQPDFAAIRDGVLDKLRGIKPGAIPFDFVLVDEGQDLDYVAFDILRLMTKHLTVCIDPKQRIYEKGSSEDQILKKLGLTRRNVSLLGAFRCCPYITKLSASLIDGEDDRRAYLNQAKTVQTERMKPLLYLATDFDDEKRRLAEVLGNRLGVDEKIAVLFPRKKQVFGFAEGLIKLGIEVETQEDLDYSSTLPKLLTYHSAKGLTFDTVLLPRLEKDSFFRMSDDQIKRLLFVGITRATKWVYLSAESGDQVEPVNEIIRSGNEEWLTVQRGDERRKIKESAGSSNDMASPDDLLDIL